MMNGSQANDGIGYSVEMKGKNILLAVALLPINTPKITDAKKANKKGGSMFSVVSRIIFAAVPSNISCIKVMPTLNGEGRNQLGIQLK